MFTPEEKEAMKEKHKEFFKNHPPDFSKIISDPLFTWGVDLANSPDFTNSPSPYDQRLAREINERIQKYAIPCEGHYVESWGGREFSCDYENAPDCCGDCICNGGSTNPETGRRVYKRVKEKASKDV